MSKTCLIKDENYYKILEALDYDVKKMTAIQIAYEKKGLDFPSYEELIRNKIILPKEKDYFKPIFRMYLYSKDRYLKLRNTVNEEIKYIESIASKNKNLDSETEGKLNKLKTTKTIINKNLEKINNNLYELKKAKQKYLSELNETRISSEVLDVFKDVEKREKEFKKDFVNEHIKYLREIAIQDIEFISLYLEKRTINPGLLVVIRNTLDSWKDITKLENNPIFNDEDFENMSLEEMSILSEIQREVITVYKKIDDISKNIIINELENTYGEEVSSHVKNVANDISGGESLFVSLSEYNNPIANYIWYLGKKASLNSQNEFNEKLEIIEKIEKVFSKYNSNELKDMLLQDSSDGTYKIPKFRTIYSQSWYNKFSELLNKLNEGLVSKDEKYVKRIIKNINKVGFVISPIELFDSNGNIKNTEEANEIISFINNLDSEIQNKILEKLKSKALKYYKEEESIKEELMLLHGNDTEKIEIEFNDWYKKHNPTFQKTFFIPDFKISSATNISFLNTSFIEIIPKKHHSSGKETGYYDNKYIQFLKNPELAEALHEMEEILKELKMYLPSKYSNKVSFNSIPFVSRSLVNSLLDSGVLSVLPNFWSKLLNDITISNENNIVSDIDIRSDGTIRPTVKVKGLNFYEEFVDDYFNKKFTMFKLEHNIDVSSTEDQIIYGKYSEELKKDFFKFIKETRKEAQQKLVEEMNLDIGTLLKVYTAAIISYKEKTKVEDTILAMRDYLANSQEMVTTPSGKIKMSASGSPITKEHGLENLLKAVDYHIHVMFGHEKTSPELVTDKKIYNKEEKQTKEAIDSRVNDLDEKLNNNEIDIDEYLKQRIALQEEYEKLGRTISGANVIDLINNYIRIKGLGWNIIAPIANINVAFFANLMESSREKYLNNGNLLRGYRLFFTDREKVKNIFHKIVTLQTVQNELYSKINSRRTNYLHPMYFTESAEFFNQAPLVVAYLLSNKVSVNDKIYSLYDIIDDDGDLIYNENEIKFVNKKDENIKFTLSLVKSRVDWLISRVHGNYDPDSIIRAESKVLYRSLLVFRKWIINSFMNRLQGETFNWIMNDIEKGRWRSYGNFFNEYGILGGTLVLSTSLVKAMLFSKSKFGKLSDLDSKNMRANITEIIFIAYITIIGALLYAMISGTEGEDGDDEEKISKIKFALIFSTNILGRLTRDITLYMDPDQFKSVLRDPIPIWGLVSDLSSTIFGTIKLMKGQPDDYTDREWEKEIDRVSKKWRSFLPYGFNTLDKIKTYATKKNLY